MMGGVSHGHVANSGDEAQSGPVAHRAHTFVEGRFCVRPILTERAELRYAAAHLPSIVVGSRLDNRISMHSMRHWPATFHLPDAPALRAI